MKTKEELRRIIAEFLDNKYPDFDQEVGKWDVNQFCHIVYETVEWVIA